MQTETIVDITDANIFQSSNLVLSNVQLKIEGRIRLSDWKDWKRKKQSIENDLWRC